MASDYTILQQSTPSATPRFNESAKGHTEKDFSKSYAQVASSVAPPVAPFCAPAVSPYSLAGLRPIPLVRTSQRSYGLKLKDGELAILREKSKALGMSVNAYIRAKALGEDYIEKPPSWLRDVLLKLYVELSRQGNNLNQIARNANKDLITAEAALSMADKQRVPMFRLMEAIELALSGRKPPDDY